MAELMTATDYCAAMIAMVWSMTSTAYKDTKPLNCLYYWGNGKWSADCNNLINASIWGRCELPKNVGGYWYNPGRYGLGDLTCKQMIDACSNVSTDFSKLTPGELLYIHDTVDHVGLYVGEYVVEGKTFNVIESSPIWYNGIQSTYVDSKGRRIRPKTGEQRGTWQKHGKMPWIDYTNGEQPLVYTIKADKDTATINFKGEGTVQITIE
jgi:hypothetical protein